MPSPRRFGGAERQGGGGGGGEGLDGGSDDEGAEAAEAAMLTEEEALIVTNRLHQVCFWQHGCLAAALLACLLALAAAIRSDSCPLLAHSSSPPSCLRVFRGRRCCAPSCCAASKSLWPRSCLRRWSTWCQVGP